MGKDFFMKFLDKQQINLHTRFAYLREGFYEVKFTTNKTIFGSSF